MDPSALWEQVLTSMRQRIGAQQTAIWLKDAIPLRLDDQTLAVEVENRYYIRWIDDNFKEIVDGVLTEIRQRPTSLQLVAKEVSSEPLPTRAVQSTSKPEPAAHRSIGLNLDQTFENFVIGECNKFAHAASRAVADAPAKSYNPLFLYGATGLGKTHLMHAIGNEITRTRPDARIVYVTAEDFMNEMIKGIRYKRMDDFHAKYRRQATVLLVDDIQFLSGRDATQEEFFHTFNALQRSGRQIVLTSDVVPKDIDRLEPRLRTRFEGGLLADLQAPDMETLRAILWQKADAQHLPIPPDLADAIANAVSGNIRELEGILNRLAALHSFTRGMQPLTLEFAREKLPNVFTQPTKYVTVPTIIEAVAQFHNLRSADITGTRRTRTLTRPRHIAMYLARLHTNLSFPELGREFGGRDHSTIQHGYRKVERELKEDADLAYKIRLIEQRLNVRPSIS